VQLQHLALLLYFAGLLKKNRRDVYPEKCGIGNVQFSLKHKSHKKLGKTYSANWKKNKAYVLASFNFALLSNEITKYREQSRLLNVRFQH